MGFGGATARLFAREGAFVMVTDIDGDGIAATVERIIAGGGSAKATILDVTSESQWELAIATTVQRFGRLDVLVNSAGTTHVHTVDKLPLKVFRQQIDVHAKSVFLGTKHAIPAMREGGGGVIVNVASMVSHIGGAYGTAYSAGKGATRIFTKATAIQHATHGIRANSIHPGWCDTPMARHVMAEATDEGQPDPRPARIPMGRLGRADEVAAAILFLASDDSSYMTGGELIVDGGVTAQ
jgi:NAD(P)-dependent dehydrogenase (short-subunit alcohol dehydrogenase family)